MSYNEIVKTAMESRDLKYSEEDENKFRVSFQNFSIIIRTQEERSLVQVAGYFTLGMPDEKKTEAFCLLNELNRKLPVQCYLDDDGDFVATHNIDIDDSTLSVAMVKAAFDRVLLTLRDGHEPMMRLRYC